MSHASPLFRSGAAVAALVCCLATVPFAAAKKVSVNRWVDDAGRIHFTDRVPAEAAGVTVTTTVDPDHNVVPAPPTPHFVPFKPARPKHRSNGRAERAAAAKAKRCARDRAQLRKLHDRMLAGYKARQYNGLMQRKRDLEDKEATDCH